MRLDGPLKWSRRPIRGARYGLHWAHGKRGSSVMLRDEVSWRSISGVLVNTPRGAAWIYFRNWS